MVNAWQYQRYDYPAETLTYVSLSCGSGVERWSKWTQVWRRGPRGSSWIHLSRHVYKGHAHIWRCQLLVRTEVVDAVDLPTPDNLVLKCVEMEPTGLHPCRHDVVAAACAASVWWQTPWICMSSAYSCVHGLSISTSCSWANVCIRNRICPFDVPVNFVCV